MASKISNVSRSYIPTRSRVPTKNTSSSSKSSLSSASKASSARPSSVSQKRTSAPVPKSTSSRTTASNVKTSSANTRSTSSANRSSSTIKNSAAAVKSTSNKGVKTTVTVSSAASKVVTSVAKAASKSVSNGVKAATKSSTAVVSNAAKAANTAAKMASTASKAVSTGAKAAAAKSGAAVGSNVAKAAVIGVNIDAASNATASKTSTNKSTKSTAVKNTENSNPKNLSTENKNKTAVVTNKSIVSGAAASIKIGVSGNSKTKNNNASEIKPTTDKKSSEKGKVAIDLSEGKADRIKCQNDTWNGGNGWSGCYSESIDAMWRINHSDKISADETHIIKNDMSNGSINGTENYRYKASMNINNNSYTGTIYPGVDKNGNNYNAFRITGLSKDDANSIMNYELENCRAFCYRVYNSEALSQDDGHTILCTGRLLDGTYTYSNCATGQKNYQTNKPLSDQYKNKKYYERSNNIEVIVDATNRNVKKINEGE